jgi:simple sugar transport system substrate-binding protein
MLLNTASRAGVSGRLGAVPLLVAAAWLMGAVAPVQADPKIKVGFIYTGTINDHGWVTGQDEGRKNLEKKFPWVETIYAESVSEADVESFIDQMADQGAKVIFTVSPGYMDGTLSAAARHPDIIFFNADGYKQAPNVGTYLADTYQTSYLMGLAAGALTKTGKVGAVSSYPTPEGTRGMDAFVLGLRSVNPKAVLIVKWLNSWFDVPASVEASETLLEEGCDLLSNGMDSSTVIEVAEAHHVPVCGTGNDGAQVAPNSFIMGNVYDWSDPYPALLQQIHDGVITPQNMQHFDQWWRLSSHAVKIYYKPGTLVNPRYKDALGSVQTDDGTGRKISVYDLILKRFDQMSADPPQFEPFTGPLIDFDGRLRVPAGQTASRAQLFNMTWRLPGVTGNWPTK